MDAYDLFITLWVGGGVMLVMGVGAFLADHLPQRYFDLLDRVIFGFWGDR